MGHQFIIINCNNVDCFYFNLMMTNFHKEQGILQDRKVNYHFKRVSFLVGYLLEIIMIMIRI